MSTPFYDLASLVVVPSGYKASKVYAQKPLTTDGQLTFSRASTATRVNSAGIIETVSSNVPRLDYLGSTCPKLLLEPSRTNLAAFNSDFSNGYWVKYAGATVTANTVTSPDGTQNADTLNTTPGQEIYATMGSKAASAITYTFSCFAKYNSAAVFQIVVSDFATSSTSGIFNLQTGVATFGQGATWSGTSVKMENYGNGWWRCILTSTSPTTTGLYVSLFTATSGSAYIYGMQCEQASYATSLIPTTTASVTRLADACYKTGVSSLIGQTEGTIFVDFVASAQNQDGGSFSCITIFGTTNENMQLYTLGATLYWYAWKSSAIFNQTADQTLVAGQRYKVAYAYKSGDWALYINGVQKRTNTSSTITAVSQFNFNTDGFGAGNAKVENKFNQTLIFKTRLTNAQLAELTAL